jgi:hypothetical protein
MSTVHLKNVRFPSVILYMLLFHTIFSVIYEKFQAFAAVSSLFRYVTQRTLVVIY